LYVGVQLTAAERATLPKKKCSGGLSGYAEFIHIWMEKTFPRRDSKEMMADGIADANAS